MINALIPGLVVLAVAGMVATAYAQSEPLFAPLDVRVQVTDVLREHGAFADKWTFTADITNREGEAVVVDIVELYPDVGVYGVTNDCISTAGVKLNPGQTKEFTACFLLNAEL